MGRPPKYPPGHPRYRVHFQAFPKGFSTLVARAAKVLGIPPRTYCYAILAREAVSTIVAAQNRALRAMPGARIWVLGPDQTWRVELIADGSETCFIQDQAVGLPQMVSEDGVGVSVFLVGKGPGHVVRYDDLCWDGRAPSGLGVRKFFENLFTPGSGDLRDEKLLGVLRAGYPAGDERLHEGPGGPLPSRDAAPDGGERLVAPADPGTHRVEELDVDFSAGPDAAPSPGAVPGADYELGDLRPGYRGVPGPGLGLPQALLPGGQRPPASENEPPGS